MSDDTRFAHLIERFEYQTIVLGDLGFHKASGASPNFKLCRSGEWNKRKGVETVLSILTVIYYIKHMRHRVWNCFETKFLICWQRSTAPLDTSINGTKALGVIWNAAGETTGYDISTTSAPLEFQFVLSISTRGPRRDTR